MHTQEQNLIAMTDAVIAIALTVFEWQPVGDTTVAAAPPRVIMNRNGISTIIYPQVTTYAHPVRLDGGAEVDLVMTYRPGRRGDMWSARVYHGDYERACEVSTTPMDAARRAFARVGAV